MILWIIGAAVLLVVLVTAWVIGTSWHSVKCRSYNTWTEGPHRLVHFLSIDVLTGLMRKEGRFGKYIPLAPPTREERKAVSRFLQSKSSSS